MWWGGPQVRAGRPRPASRAECGPGAQVIESRNGRFRLAHDFRSPAVPAAAVRSRHSAVVRVTHWITTLAFLALLVTGVEILISHPRFYWGETGNVLTPPLFKLPIPASRATVPTGYGYVLPDQNGWSRYLHFQSAWVAVLTGLLYVAFGFFKGHFRRNLLPARADLSRQGARERIARHLRFRPASEEEAWSYNVLQRLTYLLVIFVLFPLVIWTGLAMSPAIASAFPAAVTVLGGQQSARTLHFFVSVFLVLFLLVHVVMVCLAGFRSRMRSDDHRPPRHTYGANMSKLSRRKLITTGLAATAGASGLAVAAQARPALWTHPARWRRPLRPGRNADLCCAAVIDSPLPGARVRSQPDFETSVRKRSRSLGRSVPAPSGRSVRRLAPRRGWHGRPPGIVLAC